MPILKSELIVTYDFTPEAPHSAKASAAVALLTARSVGVEVPPLVNLKVDIVLIVEEHPPAQPPGAGEFIESSAVASEEAEPKPSYIKMAAHFRLFE